MLVVLPVRARERNINALKEELLDVRELERAEYHSGEALLYT